MNRQLQEILNLVNQSATLSPEEKKLIADNVKDIDKEIAIVEFKLERTEKVKKTTAILLEETIEELEQKRKAVEVQNRELEIEGSLERVRAKTMAMRNSQDVADTVAGMFDEYGKLGIETIRCGLGIMLENSEMDVWTAKAGDNGKADLVIGRLDMTFHPLLQNAYKGWKNKQESASYLLEGQDLINYYETINKQPGYPIKYDIASLPSTIYHNDFYFPEGVLYVFSLGPLSAEAAKIFMRFAGVFGQTYRRYLDLQKAEAQAREAMIEVALERVRSRAMAMHKTDELLDAAELLYKELTVLGITSMAVLYAFVQEEEKNALYYGINPVDGKIPPFPYEFPHTETEVMRSILSSWKKQEPFNVIELNEEETLKHQTWVGEIVLSTIIKNKINIPLSVKAFLEVSPKKAVIYNFNFKQGYIFIIGGAALTTAQEDLVMRFTKVFELTYRRFLDLKQAEAQAREAKIEAALEKVRSRTMAMQKSDELAETSFVLFQQFKDLGEISEQISIGIFNEEENIMELYSTLYGSQWKEATRVDLDEPVVMKKIHAGWKEQRKSLVLDLSGDDLRNYNTYRKKLSNLDYKEDRWVIHVAFFSRGTLTFSVTEPHRQDTIQLLERFAGVFDGTYTRFLDLQKAEAQTREAKIEASLEKVRSSAMAMHNSNDISVTTNVIFTELKKLDIRSKRCGVALLSKNSYIAQGHAAATSSDGEFHTLRRSIDMQQHSSLIKQYESWLAQENFISVLSGEELRSYYKLPFFYSSTNYIPPDHYEEKEYGYYIPFSEGLFYAWTEKSYSEKEVNILNRFKNIIELTFRRYFDLQKAEMQAREATIESSLEKVRGKAMAMHNSNDLVATASMVFTELRKLGISPIRCGVGLLTKESRKGQLYSATSTIDSDTLGLIGWVQLSGHPVLQNVYDTWIKGEDYFPQLSGENLRSYYEQLLSGLTVTTPDWQSGQIQYGHFLPFPVGCLYAWSDTPYNDAEVKILKRFAAIIDLTFRRYTELQKSESNAREAVKQAALDRVRAEIASMRTVKDLERITPLIWSELTIIGVPFIRCGVFIMDDSQELIHTFLSTPEGKAIAAFHLPYDSPGNISQVLNNWRLKQIYVDHWNESDFAELAVSLVKQGAISSEAQYMSTLPQDGLYLHFLPFLQGMLYAGNTSKLEEEDIKLIQSVADAFSTAYARYEDFNKLEDAKGKIEITLSELKATQSQLIQSEKMASLGELTAGIAHEIQNPLNFVNNFSEVSNELLDEMKEELTKGNNKDALAIANDVKQNLEKINHHGKRADAIVKGMLQHSRSGGGQKEPTDINALTDEYLRLCFHGLRAKDKLFNAAIKTDYDEAVGKVNIVSQDIGRVILNLLTNAFYAASRGTRAPLPPKGGFSETNYKHEPTIWVSTKRAADKVLISVRDNGPGIPQKLLDKIFQPFFTTKPTGQGTGLGLSLAYDIIKAHGGEIKVETLEGDGTAFTIELPSQI